MIGADIGFSSILLLGACLGSHVEVGAKEQDWLLLRMPGAADVCRHRQRQSLAPGTRYREDGASLTNYQ
jgi:hypothetical protein